jgi:hypothetical protein
MEPFFFFSGIKPVAAVRKRGKKLPRSKHPAPDPDLIWYAGERVKNPSDLSIQKL